MKKFLKSLLACVLAFNIITPGYAYSLFDNTETFYLQAESYQPLSKTVSIEDETAKSLQYQSCKKIKYEEPNIVDEAFKYQIKAEKIVYIPVSFSENQAPITEMHIDFKKPVFNPVLDFDNGIEVKIKPLGYYKAQYQTRNVMIDGKRTTMYAEYPLIGTKLSFKVANDVYVNGKLKIARGEKVTAFVGYAEAAMSGGGGTLEAVFFKTQDIDGKTLKLSGGISSSGKDTAFLLKTLAWAGAAFTFGGSFILLAMPGTSGTIKPQNTYSVYYKPNN